MAQQKIFVPVIIEIGNSDSKNRRELRFDRQETRFEMRSPIQEEDRLHRVNLEHGEVRHGTANHVADACRCVSVVRG